MRVNVANSIWLSPILHSRIGSLRAFLRARLEKNPAFWRWNLYAWSAFGIFAFLVRMTFYPTLEAAALSIPIQVLCACGFTALMRLVYQRPDVGVPFRLSTAVWVIALSFVAALIHASGVQFMLLELGWSNPELSSTTAWLIRLKVTWVVFMSWSLAFYWYKAEITAREAGETARRAHEEARHIELQMLRAQLDPHFLFNSLNGIAAEINPHPDTATAMVTELADYLRYSLDHRNKAVAPLTSELDAMEAYLRIEKARFGEALQSSVTADREVRRRTVPCFLLQPLVENAVKHGRDPGTNALQLEINAKLQGGMLVIEVRNSGRLKPDYYQREGVGLSTLRKRLDLHYPLRHKFIMNQGDGIVIARLELEGEPCFG